MHHSEALPPTSHSLWQRPAVYDAETAGYLGWSDVLFEEPNGFHPALLESNLVNGSGEHEMSKEGGKLSAILFFMDQ